MEFFEIMLVILFKLHVFSFFKKYPKRCWYAFENDQLKFYSNVITNIKAVTWRTITLIC